MDSATTTMSIKGQIVIPQPFRQEYNLQPGDTIIVRKIGGQLVLERQNVPLKEFFTQLRKKYAKPGFEYSSAEYERARERGEK